MPKAQKRARRRNYSQIAGTYAQSEFVMPGSAKKNPRTSLRGATASGLIRKMRALGNEQKDVLRAQALVRRSMTLKTTPQQRKQITALFAKKAREAKRNPVYKQGALQKSQTSWYRPNPRKRKARRKNAYIEGMYKSGREMPNLTYQQMLDKTLASARKEKKNPRKVRRNGTSAEHLATAERLSKFAEKMLAATKGNTDTGKAVAIENGLSALRSANQELTWVTPSAEERKVGARVNALRTKFISLPRKNCDCPPKKNPRTFKARSKVKGARLSFTLTAYDAKGARIASESRKTSKSHAEASARRLVGKTLRGKRVNKVVLSDGKR